MSAEPRASQPLPLMPEDLASGGRKQAESTDPFIPTAVLLETPGYDGMEAMARTFVQEFAVMGWSRDRITRMFATTAFAGPNAVYRARGAEFVQTLIGEVLGPEPEAPAGEGG